jgi:hypothetical protein
MNPSKGFWLVFYTLTEKPREFVSRILWLLALAGISFGKGGK